MKKITFKQFLLTSLMLFGVFFGAGNLIFPPFLGKQAGSNFFIAIIGFSISAVFFCMLGVVISIKENGIDNILNKIDPFFTFIYPTAIYLSIGPFLAVPRASALSFSIAFEPIIKQDVTKYRLIYTIIFFLLVFLFSLSPTKLFNKIGKILTPLLLLLLLIVFFSLVYKFRNIQLIKPIEIYEKVPFIKGFIEGYNTMDTLGGLLYGLLVVITLNGMGIKNHNLLKSYSKKIVILTGFLLFLVYSLIAYLGAIIGSIHPEIDDKIELLRKIVEISVGKYGVIILSLIFLLACFSVSVGLITTISKYFSNKYKILDYKLCLAIGIIISAILANFGFDEILKYSIPILLILYPVTIMLIIMPIFSKYYNNSKWVNIPTVYVCIFFSIMEVFKISIFEKLPLYGKDMLWLVPTISIYLIMIISYNILKYRERI